MKTTNNESARAIATEFMLFIGIFGFAVLATITIFILSLVLI
jgi:hypothetical protein